MKVLNVINSVSFLRCLLASSWKYYKVAFTTTDICKVKEVKHEQKKNETIFVVLKNGYKGNALYFAKYFYHFVLIYTRSARI